MATLAVSSALTSDDQHPHLRPGSSSNTAGLNNNSNNRYMEEALARGLSAEDYQRAREQVTKLLQRQNASNGSTVDLSGSPLVSPSTTNLLPGFHSSAPVSVAANTASTSPRQSPLPLKPAFTYEGSSVSKKPPAVVPSHVEAGDVSLETMDTQSTAMELLGLGLMPDESNNSGMDVDTSTIPSSSSNALSGNTNAQTDQEYVPIDPALEGEGEGSDPTNVRRSNRARTAAHATVGSQDFLYMYPGSSSDVGLAEAESQSPKPDFGESSIASQSTATTQESQLSLSPAKRKKQQVSGAEDGSVAKSQSATGTNLTTGGPDAPPSPQKAAKGPAPNLVKKDRSGKPPFSYAALIGQAINSKPDKRISLADIYNYICGNYSYYKKEDSGWQNSIRHNLSLNECFTKVPRAEGDAPGKGSFWCIVPGKEEQFVGGGFIKKGHLAKGPKPAKSSSKTTHAAKEEKDELEQETAGPSRLPEYERVKRDDDEEEEDKLPTSEGDQLPQSPLIAEDEGDGDDYDDSVSKRPSKKTKRNPPVPTTPKSPSKSRAAKSPSKAKSSRSGRSTVPPSPNPSSNAPSSGARPGLRSNTIIPDASADKMDEDSGAEDTSRSPNRSGRRQKTRSYPASDFGDPINSYADDFDFGDRKLSTPTRHSHHRSLSRHLRYESSSPELEFGSSTYGADGPRRHARSQSFAAAGSVPEYGRTTYNVGSGYTFLPPAQITNTGLNLRSPDPVVSSIFNSSAVPSSPVIGSTSYLASTHFQSPVSSMRSRFEDASAARDEREGSVAESSINGAEDMNSEGGIFSHGHNTPHRPLSHGEEEEAEDMPDISSSTLAASHFLQMMQLGLNEETAMQQSPNYHGSPVKRVYRSDETGAEFEGRQGGRLESGYQQEVDNIQ